MAIMALQRAMLTLQLRLFLPTWSRAGYNIRHLHATLPYHSNCDFGSPCICSECVQVQRIPTCEICGVFPTQYQSSNYGYDRKGVGGYTFTSFCTQCWERHRDTEKKEEASRNQMQILRKEQVANMLNNLRSLHSGDQVPLAYAVDKFGAQFRAIHYYSKSPRWYQRRIVENLSHDLQVVKLRNRYMCSKQRVDGMDFELWWDH